jgi:hypothetical protein
MIKEHQPLPRQEKPWIVVAEAQQIQGAVLFLVRHASSASKACKQVQEEYQRNGWETPANTMAYRITKFCKTQAIQMIGKVFS